MKRILSAIFFLIYGMAAFPQDRTAGNAADSAAFAEAGWTVIELGRGAELKSAQIEMFGSVQNISIIRYPASRFRTGFLHCPGNMAGTTGKKAEEAGACFAINGSFFNVRQKTPNVYFRSGDELLGRTLARETYRVDGIIALRKNGRKVMVAKSDTTQYMQIAGKWHNVLASGPVLMTDGKEEGPFRESPFFAGRHPRSIMGTDSRGNVYLIVIDGRFPGKADGVSIPEAAFICRILGMEDAINLDGGGSSSLWTSETGVVSHPSDNGRFDHEGERTVPNIIIVREKGRHLR